MIADDDYANVFNMYLCLTDAQIGILGALTALGRATLYAALGHSQLSGIDETIQTLETLRDRLGEPIWQIKGDLDEADAAMMGGASA